MSRSTPSPDVTPVVNETVRFYGPGIADKIEAAQAAGAEQGVIDLYLTTLLLADDKGDLSTTGLEPMFDWLVANGVLSWQRVEGPHDEILTLVEWTARDD